MYLIVTQLGSAPTQLARTTRGSPGSGRASSLPPALPPTFSWPQGRHGPMWAPWKFNKNESQDNKRYFSKLILNYVCIQKRNKYKPHANNHIFDNLKLKYFKILNWFHSRLCLKFIHLCSIKYVFRCKLFNVS